MSGDFRIDPFRPNTGRVRRYRVAHHSIAHILMATLRRALMQTLRSVVGMRWMSIFRSAFLLVLCLLLVRPALAVSPPKTAPQPDTSSQQADEDPLGRSTPYGTVVGFVRAAKVKDYARAAQYLDTRKKGAAAEKLAEQLQIVLDRGLTTNLDRLSRKPEGDLQDGLPTTKNRVGTVGTGSGDLDILVERMERRGQIPIWLFSSETLVSSPPPPRRRARSIRKSMFQGPW